MITFTKLLRLLAKGKDVQKVTKINNTSFVIDFTNAQPYLVFIKLNHFYCVGDNKYNEKKRYLTDDYGRSFFVIDGNIMMSE